MKPAYNVRIGSLSIDSQQIRTNGYPVDIGVDLQMNRINTAQIFLHFESQGSIAPGDPVEIELGVDGSQKVFTGMIQELKKGMQGWTLYCESTLVSLVNRRVNQLYEKQSVGDMVNDFAQISNVATGLVERGIEYPVYAFGDDRPMFEHILDLARRNGFDCYADTEDQLVFAKYTGQAAHPVQYGVNILEHKLDEHIASVSGVEVYGESPASLGQGADAYSWLTKKEVKGSAGPTTGTTLRFSDPTLKDLDSASLVAQAILEQRSKAKSGSLKVLGNSDAKLGDAVQISNMPDRSLDGTYKITGIKHLLNTVNGYTTTIYWTED